MKTKEDILQDFPNLFSNIQPLDFSVAPGWVDIVYDLCKQINEKWPETKVLQIKEKFGTLSFYIEAPEIYNVINEAEKISCNTCYFCGKFPAKLDTSKNRILTLCEECSKKRS